VGRLTVDGQFARYFDNIVGIGFDALVARETRNVKHLRGAALYLPVVLKTTFLTMRPPWVRIAYDDQVIETRSLMTVIANGPREGGTFLVAPQAKTDDGWLDLIVADDVPRLKVLSMIPHFIKGTHLSQDCVHSAVAKRVVITSDDPLYVHVDGEVLWEPAHEVAVDVYPAALRMLAARSGAGPQDS
jgi:diacylglycerol kinase (ATP)